MIGAMLDASQLAGELLDPSLAVMVVLAFVLRYQLGPAVLRSWAASLERDASGSRDARAGSPEAAVLDAFEHRMASVLDRQLDAKLDAALDKKLAPVREEIGELVQRSATHSTALGTVRTEVAYLRGRVDQQSQPQADSRADVPQARGGQGA